MNAVILVGWAMRERFGMLRALAFCGALVGLTEMAAAKSVTELVFDPARGKFVDLSFDKYDAIGTGTWLDQGFVTDFTMEGYELSTLAPDFFNFLADSNPGPVPVSFGMTFSRANRQPFSLKSLSVPQMFSGWLGLLDFTPSERSGLSSEDGLVNYNLNVRYDNLILRGTKADGTTFTTAVSAFDFAKDIQILGESLPGVRSGIFSPTGRLRSMLSNLVSLTVSVGIPSWDELIASTLRASPLPEGIPPAPIACLVQSWQCEVPGVGEYSLFIQSDNYGNWGTALTLSSASFTLPDEPASVPLPAGAALLGSSLIGLGLLAARRRVQS